MKFRSTRQSGIESVSLALALRRGLAPDGGLYVPESFEPRKTPTNELTSRRTLASFGTEVLRPFFAGDALSDRLPAIAEGAFNFPAPLVKLTEDLSVLELFHGPTAAFKDFGARFLARCLAHISCSPYRARAILVATSGDTGGAVAAAFHEPGPTDTYVIVLYPKGRVSPLQEKQLTCLGDNVVAYAVDGTFDDCQRMVKDVLRAEATREIELSSANSISLGRLLPQSVYYAYASSNVFETTQKPASFIIPSGNLGNAVACVWAKKMGFPIDQIVLAHNANRGVVDLLARGVYEAQPTTATLASAMDVGNPSNLERLRSLYPDVATLQRAVSATSTTDEEILRTITRCEREWNYLPCPHTATAFASYEIVPPSARAKPWVLVATAHPAKFNEIMIRAIGREIALPECLRTVLTLPSTVTDLPASSEALEAELTKLKARLPPP